MGTRTRKLKEAGQSLWLDNIQRRELHDNTLKNMISEDGICGVTSNPTDCRACKRKKSFFRYLPCGHHRRYKGRSKAFFAGL